MSLITLHKSMPIKKKAKCQTLEEAARRDAHCKLVAQLERLDLVDSCCDICHCDCLSTHDSSSNTSIGIGGLTYDECAELQEIEDELTMLEELQRLENETKLNTNAQQRQSNECTDSKKTKVKLKTHRKSASNLSVPTLPEEPTTSTVAEPVEHISRSAIRNRTADTDKRRAKSAGSSCSQSRNASGRKLEAVQHARDCEILQDLLTTIDGATSLPKLSIAGKTKSKSQQTLSSTKNKSSSTALTLPPAQCQQQQLCASMANLCLASTIREAYQRVPMHDKKILNRMAVKRNQQAVAKEHAWLARKLWENERLERELLKCEQLEEYKRAVHDKQFQDYLETKARLNALAQRDLNQLQSLRATLHDKDERAKQRLTALRMEREMQLCQRRSDELRRNEAVTVQQEEQHLDETLRKRDICLRLTQRLRRADELRTQMLSSYLKRLQHDNYMEQLQHEEHWRERQQYEQLKREQLKEQIQRKRQQCQRFTEGRQRRNEALTRTAKISASLRELVRQSVTPEGGSAATNAITAFYTQNQATLNRLLLDRPPPPKLAALNK